MLYMEDFYMIEENLNIEQSILDNQLKISHHFLDYIKNNNGHISFELKKKLTDEYLKLLSIVNGVDTIMNCNLKKTLSHSPTNSSQTTSLQKNNNEFISSTTKKDLFNSCLRTLNTLNNTPTYVIK